MLCTPVFIFTSGSSAPLVHPHCVFSICRYLPYSIHFSEFMPMFYTRKRTKHEILESTIFLRYENGRQRLLGAQSINTENLFKCGINLMIESMEHLIYGQLNPQSTFRSSSPSFPQHKISPCISYNVTELAHTGTKAYQGFIR